MASSSALRLRLPPPPPKSPGTSKVAPGTSKPISKLPQTKSPARKSSVKRGLSPVITPESIDPDTILAQAASFDQPHFAALLGLLSDYYHNETALVDDEIYDELEDLYTLKFGPYKIIGAEPRGEKVDLPYYLSSLRKIKDDKEINRWLQSYQGPYIIMDKIDGLSLLLVRKTEAGRTTTKLYTRGGGVRGKDVSHLLDYIRIPTLPVDMAVRGEIVMPKAAFERVKSNRKDKDFKNARNLAGGIINSQKSFNPVLARELVFYAYRIMESPALPSEQMVTLQELGFEVPSPGSIAQIDRVTLKNYLLERKELAPYEIDGLVIYQDLPIEYPNDENPRQVVAFKMGSEKATTTVLDIIWQPSKDRYLTPVVHYEMRHLSGGDLEQASGYNARFIVENKIGPGAVILVTRSGDTIPKILSVIEPAPDGPGLPDPAIYGRYEWDENGVKFRLLEDNDKVRINKIHHFITTIDLKNFGPGRIAMLVDNGIKSVSDLIKATPSTFTLIPGIGPKLSHQIYNDLHQKLTGIGLARLLDAGGFFSGVGERRFDEIVAVYPDFLSRVNDPDLPEQIRAIRGFNKLADQITAQLPAFVEWLADHPEISVTSISLMPGSSVSSGSLGELSALAGKSIIFSGFRNKDWEAQIKAAGGKVGSAVSRNTSMVVMDNLQDIMGKAQKALDLGIPLISRADFRVQYGLR